jgi:uncharacterized membrane protein
MSYHELTLLHLATVLPAFAIGSWLMLRRKGTPGHRRLGRIYLLLMLATGLITLFMPAQVGPAWRGHFGFIHLLSLLTLVCVPMAYLAIRHGNVRLHQGNMIGLYVGGLLIAGSFALMPGRLLNQWLFG